MKKVVLAIAVIAMVGCFASCKKTCKCTTYAAGASSTTEINLDDMEKTFGVKIDKCSNMNSVAELPVIGKTGVECK